MNHLIKRGQLRRAASKTLSVTLSATTTLWLVGSSLFLGVPVASASNDAVVSDITATNPRIAPLGESELAVLGVNIIMDANDANNNKTLQSFVVQLKSDDGNDRSALANIETARFYSDSGLSGTGGQFDSNDALVQTVTRTEAGAATTLAAATLVDNAGANACFAVAAEAGVIIGDTVKFDTGVSSFVTAIVDGPDDDVNTAGDADCGDAAGEWEATGLIPAGAVAGDYVLGDAVREVNNLVGVVNSGDGALAFTDYGAAGLHAGWEEGVVFGDTVGDANTDILNYTPPTTDAGNDAGNDMFITFLTAGGVANQTFAASIWPDASSRIMLNDIDATPVRDIPVSSNTTNNESKTVTFGSDNVAPTITNVWTYDNDADGNVDRVRVLFSESMANTVTTSANFKSAIGGNASSIESLPASVDEIDLAANGTWQTTTVLNDTLQIDFGGDGAHAVADACGTDVETTYCNATANTGDTFSAVYDQDATGDLTDATGTLLADATVTTTDKARPVLLGAQIRDNDGDSKMDELRLTGSETWGGSSTVSGVELRRTDVNPNTIYVLSGVTGFVTSAGAVADANGNAATANTNDIVRIAVTEQGSDVDGVFQVNYTAASTLTDGAANEARSITGLAAGAGSASVVQQAWIVDIDNVAAGGVIDGGLDNDGQIDALVVIFNSTVDVDEDAGGNLATLDMTLSGGYAFQAAAPLDEDDDALLVFPIVQSGASDSDLTPDWTYNNDGAADGEALCSIGNTVNNCTLAADILVDSINSASVTEQNHAGAVLLTATLYETTADDIWKTGETLVMTFSEDVDPASFRTLYANDAFLNGPADFGWAGVTAAEMPNSVSVSVSGRTVTATANADATAALAAGDTIMAGVHEILDMQGNFSPEPNTGSGVVPGFGVVEQGLAAAINLVVTPNVAPAVLRILTNDANNNGILDSFILELAGLVSPSSIVLADFAAARGANFNVNILGQAAVCGGAAGDNWACSTTDVTPDLTITSVTTVNGGNDSRLLVAYSEVGENTGSHPQLKYVQGTLADLAANKIATFNASATNNALVDMNVTNGAGDFPTRDMVAPLAMHKLLKDRDMDQKIDQLVIVFSETVLNGAATNVNGVLTSQGWVVAGKGLAANGATINNTDYQQYTFTTLSAVWQADVTEGTSADATTVGVSYTSSGQVRDTGGNVLGNVAAGGEVTNITVVTPPSTMMDGALFQGTGAEVWIAKHVGSQMFRRHVLFSNFDTFYPHLAPFWSNVESVSDATVTAHSLSAWIRVAGTAPVYEINDDNTKHWITCADDSVAGQDCANEWSMSGRNSAGIYDVNTAEFNSYVTGATVIMPDQTNQ